MLWSISLSGFLPATAPLTELPAPLRPLDDLGAALPNMNDRQAVRTELVPRLRGIPRLEEHCALPEPETERLMLLFSYFASAYVHATGEATVQRIPAEIAVPLTRLAQRVGRPPILAYANYCLTNWSGTGSFNPDHLTLLQNFTGRNKRDEDWFILIHVAIEHAAAPAVRALHDHADQLSDPAVATHLLPTLLASLTEMNRLLARMGENCRPEVYFHGVRPYIFGFTDTVYEGCFDGKPQTVRGETGAQSSIVPCFVSALGVVHQDSLLTRHLADMRNYMPVPHREFLATLDQKARAGQALRQAAQADAALVDIYNECLAGLLAFRRGHLGLAVDYIAKKVSSPQGTGGTPFIEWLSKLVEETEAQKL